jgi:phospholipid-binding lipoprotein MlaA
LRFNQHLDRWLLNPVTRVYGFIVPAAGRRAVRRIFANLNCPSILVNDLLQREWKDAGVTASRFALNTTIGLAGMLDPATALGLERHDSDFGQTLALAGVKSGPFIMLPALGPITFRDFFGLFVDALFRPTTYFLGPGAEIIYNGSSGFVTREGNFEALQALEASSVDYYSALRNAYYQDRTAMIWKRREHHRPASGEEGPGPLRKVRRPWRSRPGGPITS